MADGVYSATAAAAAVQMLLMGRKISAAEAERRNLVAEVFPAAKFREEVHL